MHTAFHPWFVFFLLSMACVMAVLGIGMPCLRDGMRLNDTSREALLWMAGFIVYAILDYCVFTP